MVVRAGSERRISSARSARPEQAMAAMGGSSRKLDADGGAAHRPRSAAASRTSPKSSARQDGASGGGRPPTHRDRPTSARSISSIRSLDLDGASPADIRAMSAGRRRSEAAGGKKGGAQEDLTEKDAAKKAAAQLAIPEGVDPEEQLPPQEEALLGVDPDDSALLTDAFGVADRDRGRALVRRLRLATKLMMKMSPRSSNGSGAGGGKAASDAPASQAVQPAGRRSPKVTGGLSSGSSKRAGTAAGGRSSTADLSSKSGKEQSSKSGKESKDTGPTEEEKAALGDLDLDEEIDVARARSRYFCRPRALFCVFGGASGLHDLLVPGLRSLIKKGVVTTAVMMGGVMLTGGTKAGVMDMVGAALERTEEGPLRVIGVCPKGVI